MRIHPLTVTASRQRRLEDVLATFLGGDISDQHQRRQQLLAAHPDLAEELVSLFENHDLIRQLAESPPERLSGSLPCGHDEPTPRGRTTESSMPSKCGPATSDLKCFRPWREPLSTVPCRYGDYELIKEIGEEAWGLSMRRGS